MDISTFILTRQRKTSGGRRHGNGWLGAVETAGSERRRKPQKKLALAAYQSGQIEAAQRWINRSRNASVSQWLQAKLWLRAGEVERAAACLAQVVRQFPITPPGTNEPVASSFQDNLFMLFGNDYPEQRQAPNQVLGELGVLRLARRDYH